MKSRNPESGHFVLWLLLSLVVLLAVAAGIGLLLLQRFSAELPSVDALLELQLSEPMRVYTQEGALIGEFGSERRVLAAYDELPETLIQAFLAAEDERFFRHDGVDAWGLLRAALVVARTGEKSQGGSTITMQLARNVFLSSEKTYTRKLREILLARRIEDHLEKTEILALYLNKIFLGERAYGVGAAAQVYFNKTPLALSLAEAATLAALPKAPSRDNPIANPQRARERRDYVLRRMHGAGFIDAETRDAALATPLVVTPYRPVVAVDAHYVAEMVRAEMLNRYGDKAYSDGLRVTTTLKADEQAAAVTAVRVGLHAYDERQGWRGVERRLSEEEQVPEQAQAVLTALPQLPGLELAWVSAVDTEGLSWRASSGLEGRLATANMAWAKLKEADSLRVGDVIRLRRVGEGWRLAQWPQAQAALVALEPASGAIIALCGGYDFFASKFNRATQGQRQAGSSFKPFLYVAALEAGFTPASVVLDAPVVFDDPALEAAWRPQNYSGKFYGPTRLREALVHSRNLVSIRLLQAIGFDRARRSISAFGLPEARMPRDLTMALGSAVFTPLELAQAYAVFANGGYRISPQLIDRIETSDGRLLWSRASANDAAPAAAFAADDAMVEGGAPAPDVSPVATWLVRDMLREVAVRGTAAKVRELGRRDLSGKTGTTNDETDAWFAGFDQTRVGVVWVGHDQPQPLGRGEVGGRAALPIWMDYMRVALEGVPEDFPSPPPGIVSVRIDAETGALASARNADARFEFIQADRLPEAGSARTPERPRSEPELDDLF